MSSEVLWRIFTKLGGCLKVDLPFALEGFFFEKVNGSTGQRVTFTFHYIIDAPTSHHTAAKGPFCFAAAESNSAPFAALHLNGVCTWTSQLPLRGSFSKRSTGRRVNGSNGSMGHISTLYVGGPRNCPWGVLFRKGHRSTGQRVKRVNGSNGSTGQRATFTFTILYMIADDARLTPPCCKKHTASFACSTGKFPSINILY